MRGWQDGLEGEGNWRQAWIWSTAEGEVGRCAKEANKEWVLGLLPNGQRGFQRPFSKVVHNLEPYKVLEPLSGNSVGNLIKERQ